MNNLSTFKNIIEKNELYIYLYFIGISAKNPNEIYPILENYLNNLSKSISYDEILNNIRTILIDYQEEKLILNISKKNEHYSSLYTKGKLEELSINRQIGNDLEVSYTYFDGITNYTINFINSNEDTYDYLMNDIPKKIKKLSKDN